MSKKKDLVRLMGGMFKVGVSLNVLMKIVVEKIVVDSFVELILILFVMIMFDGFLNIIEVFVDE